MKIRFTTLGCKLNFAESSAIGKELLEQGHTKAKRGEKADICVVNTCTVTDTADHKDIQAIHRLRRENPDAIIIVTGCYAQLTLHNKQKEALHPMEKTFPWDEVDYVLDQEDKFHIAELVQQFTEQNASKPATGNIPQNALYQVNNKCFTDSRQAYREMETYYPAYSREDRTRCFLKVQDGCNYFCTYCTIPLARGKSRNGSIASCVAQAEQAIKEGAKEIVLTGVNIGDFGRTTGETFIDLLHALDNINGDFRIRISSCEPNLLTDEIIDFVARSNHFAPHFHIPLQSGSDNVLRIMHRHYDTSLFRERIMHIKKVMPNAFIGVDCMVGVRGETDEDWNTYVEFINSLPVSQLHVFTYSERANTRMLEMDLYVVPQLERKRRSDQLHAISAQKLSAFYAEHKGDKASVLWEGKHISAPDCQQSLDRTQYSQHTLDSQQPSPSAQYSQQNLDSTQYSQQPIDLMSGFTENYIRVTRPYDKAKINTFEEIII